MGDTTQVNRRTHNKNRHESRMHPPPPPMFPFLLRLASEPGATTHHLQHTDILPPSKHSQFQSRHMLFCTQTPTTPRLQGPLAPSSWYLPQVHTTKQITSTSHTTITTLKNSKILDEKRRSLQVVFCSFESSSNNFEDLNTTYHTMTHPSLTTRGALILG